VAAAIVLAGISSTLGAVNYVTTVVKLRARGLLAAPAADGLGAVPRACIQLAGLPC
jgi:hypothetical protein